MTRAVVDNFSIHTGYGFLIVPGLPTGVYVHAADCLGAARDDLAPGDVVLITTLHRNESGRWRAFGVQFECSDRTFLPGEVWRAP